MYLCIILLGYEYMYVCKNILCSCVLMYLYMNVFMYVFMYVLMYASIHV